MMNSDMNWTTQIGNAFLAQQQDVMDAVQRQRALAQRYGYLRSNGQVVVSGGPYITIMPVNPGFVVVPYYDPAIVFFAPRPGFVVGGAIRFGFGVTIGGFFAPWGWAAGRHPLRLGRACRVPEQRALGQDLGEPGGYVHPYAAIRRPAPGLCVRPRRMRSIRARSRSEMRRAKAGRRLAKSTGKGAARKICGFKTRRTTVSFSGACRSRPGPSTVAAAN